jgi:hypothetical protein
MADGAMPAAKRDLGQRPELTWLPVDRLSVDEIYQRSLETPAGKRLVKKIAAEFCWAAFQAILATPSGDDRWLVIDGQHRVMAARFIGLALVPAVVVHGIDARAQAVAFIDANRNRVAMSAQALFHAELCTGDVAAHTVKRLCDDSGIELLRYPLAAGKTPAGKSGAAPALRRILARRGEALTAAAIRAVAARYRRVPGALRAPFFKAAADFLAAGGSEAGLGAALWATLPEDLISAAQNRGKEGRIAAIVDRLRAAEQISDPVGRAIGSRRAAAPERANA